MKNNIFDTPIQFTLRMVMENNILEYYNLKEIGQGGPEIGNFKVNDVQVTQNFFGGPLIHDDSQIIIPIYIRKFFFSGFRMCKINVQSLEYKVFGKKENLIFLSHLDQEKVFFFKDLNKTKLFEINLPL